MYSIQRSCQSALRNSNGVVARANGSRRAFSRTVARSKGGLPVFLEPSSTELSTLLATINSKILLPEHLTRDQQRLVFKHKSRAKLESEPVEVTIGEVTLPLEFIDRNFRPSRWDSLKGVLYKSQTADDWENVVRLLEGFYNAGIAVQPSWQSLIVRKLNESGHHNLVLKALQRVKATGLKLSNREVAVRVLKGAHDRATASDWDKTETAKALRFARQIVELMEDEEHHAVSSKSTTTEQGDWRSKPFVVAVPTELAAVMAQKHEGDMQVVETLANRLVNALKQEIVATQPATTQAQTTLNRIASLATKTEADFKNGSEQTVALNTYCADLTEQLVIWNALKTSKAVLGADMPLAEEAAEYETKTKAALDQGLQALPNLQKRGAATLRSAYPAYIQEQLQKC